MINPSIWQDENFGKLSHLARLLFVGLFSNADDEGKIRANESYIRSTIFMYDEITLADVRQAVDEVSDKMKTVDLYEVNGNRYIQLKKWNDYQKQREERMQKSVLPSPVRQVSDTRQTNVSQSPAQVKLSKLSKLRSVSRVGEYEGKGRVSAADGGVGYKALKEKVKSLKGEKIL